MIQSSLSAFASQFKSDSGGKGESSQDQTHEISREGEPSPYHVNPSEREEGELVSDEEDPNLDRGDPNLTQLLLAEEEQRDFESFTLASPIVSQKGKKGKVPFMEGFPGESEILFLSSAGSTTD